MDPIAFDKNGKMSCRISDTPQWAPGAVADPAANGDSGSLPVTINKMRAMNATSKFSSQANGHDAAYAIDNSSGTWWEPAANDPAPSLTIELSPATRFDPVEYFSIDSMRLMFNAGGGMGGGRGMGAGRGMGGPGRGRGAEGGAAAAAPAAPAPAAESAPARTPTQAYQYKIEASNDGNTFTTVLDQTANSVNRNTIFEEIPPTVARFVRLTLTNWPGATPPGVIEFTVFGKADRHDPPAVSATQPDIRQ
jgi:hypothetical protein